MSLRKLSILVLLSLASGAAGAVERVERGNLVLEDMPAIPPALTERLEQYQNTRSAGFASWLSDGGILVTTRFGDTSQVHRVSRPLGARYQLTFFPEPVSSASVPPDPALNGFVYSRDVGGNEFYQLYWFDFASGESALLTDGSSRNNGVPVWYLLARDEGHGFAKKPNRDYFQAATVMFFRQLFEGELAQ